MSVKICGHKIHWQKPIKLYSYFKITTAIFALGLVMTQAAPSAEAGQISAPCAQQASSGGAGPCLLPLHPSSSPGMDTPVSSKTAPDRAQRAAGPQISPAMALALALGVRTVSGPFEKTPVQAPIRKAAQKPAYPHGPQASLLPGCDGCVPARSGGVRPALIAMEK